MADSNGGGEKVHIGLETIYKSRKQRRDQILMTVCQKLSGANLKKLPP